MRLEDEMNDIINTWKYENYKVNIGDEIYNREQGRYYLSYEFFIDGKILFFGNDFGCSPMHSIDSEDAVMALLSFLTLKLGDVEEEYFQEHEYTQEQLDWSNSWECELLQCYIFDREEELHNEER